MALELVPIGTILALLAKQVNKTALAAQDVVFQKESFKSLSEHLFEIEPVLKELQLQKLNDSKSARHALESLEADVKKANTLVEKYKHRGRFYLLLKCRSIVQEVEQVTRDIGHSLQVLNVANTEVLSAIADQVTRLQNEMQRAELEASQSQRQIVDKLREGLEKRKLDQGFANDILEEIARAVGIPIEPSEISKELASFRKEKEEAVNRKERAEAFFLQQVIELLSQADAAKDYEDVKKQYMERATAIERYNQTEHQIRPLKSFRCPISGAVMIDPVSLCTGTTCERAEIEAWIDRGERTDPETHEFIEDFQLRPNLPVRQSIEEWRELNYCLKIRYSEIKLLSGEDSSVLEALEQMQILISENPINKDWISIGGLTDKIVSTLGSSRNRDVKRKVLNTLRVIVEGHARNKDKVVDSHGLDHIIPCLGRDSSISNPAVELLCELLLDRSGINVSVSRRIAQERSAFLFLVALLSGPVKESADIAEEILMKLFEEDEENICRAAKEGWYKPLVDRIVRGPGPSKLLMVRTLNNMELIDQDLKKLGEEGIFPPLLALLSGNIESKELSLSTLVKLSGCESNKELFASAGGVPCVLNLMFSSQVRTIIKVKCCEILEKLSSDCDGIRFLIDENGSQVELEPIITNLLAFLLDPISSHDLRKPALRVLLEICKSEASLVKKAVVDADGLFLVLHFLDDTNPEVREIAISLLFIFSQQEPNGVVEYLRKSRRLEALVSYLDSDDKTETQIAAAGLLGNLPKSEVALTMRLIELDGLDAIIKMLRTGTMEAKESALNALSIFTDPTNMESQRHVVAKDAYPMLVKILKGGSVKAKARAAALIGNLSVSTLKLANATGPTGCWCVRRERVPSCAAHGGICSVNGTFCMLEARALPDLVRLLHEKVHETAFEVIQALSTLVRESSPQRGTKVLHGADAVKPLLEILNWGTDPLKEEALGLLEKVFMSKEMVELYGPTARLLLVGLTSRGLHGDSNIVRKAARVMSNVERYSRSSTMPLVL